MALRALASYKITNFDWLTIHYADDSEKTLEATSCIITGGTTPYKGQTTYGVSSIQIYNPSGIIVDSVKYDVSGVYSIEAQNDLGRGWPTIQQLQKTSAALAAGHPAHPANTASLAAKQFKGRASLAAHVLGAESAATPTWKLVALAAVAGVAGYMTPGLLKKLKKK